jgi:hypothetical protein
MSNKAECPACDSYTSGIYTAFENGEQCPTCGLPAEAAAAVLAARERGASEELVQRAAKAERRAAAAEREAGRLRAALDRIGRLYTEVREESP